MHQDMEIFRDIGSLLHHEWMCDKEARIYAPNQRNYEIPKHIKVGYINQKPQIAK